MASATVHLDTTMNIIRDRFAARLTYPHGREEVELYSKVFADFRAKTDIICSDAPI